MNFDDMTREEIAEKYGLKMGNKNKVTLIKEVKDLPQDMPEFKPDMSKLSPTQQHVAGYVQTAKKDAPKPKIEVIRDNFTRIEMEIPKGVTRGNEYEYAWLSINDLASSVYPGSKWEIVTMSNHSHTPRRLFGNDGAITYKGQNILGYCYRYVQEAEQEEIVNDFNKKTERMTETKEVVGESASRVDPGSTGKIFEQQVLNPEEEYDFQ